MQIRSRPSAFLGRFFERPHLFHSLWRFTAVKIMACSLRFPNGWLHGFRGCLAARASPASVRLTADRECGSLAREEKSHHLRPAGGIISQSAEAHPELSPNWHPIQEWTYLTGK